MADIPVVYSRAERTTAAVALAVLAVMTLVAVDILTGGKLSGGRTQHVEETDDGS